MRKLTCLLAAAIVAVAVSNLHAQPSLSEHHDASEKTKAERWMKNFEIQKGGTLAYQYGKQMLTELANIEGSSGAYIFLAMDNDKETIVFKPLNKDGVMFQGLAFDNGTMCPPYCPCDEPCDGDNSTISTLGKRIDESLGIKMIEKYRSFHSTHDAFFLERAFLKSILSRRDVEAIYFANGLDDLGQEHLIMIGVNKKNQLIWDGPVHYLNKTSLPDYPQYPVAKTR